MNANDKYLFISIFEVIYIYYMIFIFKTKINFDSIFSNGPAFTNTKLGKLLNSKTNNYFFHSFEHSKIPKCFVCPFGKTMTVIALLWFMIRNLSKLLKDKNKYVISFFSILTLLNFNTLVYILPIMLLEYYMYKTNM